MGFVILMSSVIEQMAMLIVSGVMIGYICSAVTDLSSPLRKMRIL